VDSPVIMDGTTLTCAAVAATALALIGERPWRGADGPVRPRGKLRNHDP
jgi:hypothetical protein